MAKKYLNTKKLSYEDIDVSKDKIAAGEMISISHQRGVPVLDIDGNIIVGFNTEKIDKAIYG
jgi:glutaredoxin